MVRTATKLFGVVLLLIGIMGFIPAFTPDDHLLGIFHVDALHNVIHLGSGLFALWAGFASYGASRLYFQVFGVIYALVTVLGIAYGDDDILGVLANNTADVVLHVVIAVTALMLGFGTRPRDEKVVV